MKLRHLIRHTLTRLGCGLLLLGAGPVCAQSLPTVTITGVAYDNDSAKVLFAPVAGAVDYRIVPVNADGSLGTSVKYAGQFQAYSAGAYSQFVAAPKLSVEENGLPAGGATYVIQAVDCLGPFPQGNLYTANNSPAFPSVMDAMSLLGGDQGMALDGFTSTNGQGAYNNVPHVVAQSQPFILKGSGTPTLPSGADATQVTYDPFTSGTVTHMEVDPAGESATWTVQAALPWTVFEEQADTTNTKPFVMGKHFMDVLFDGGTPGTNNPLHQGHGVLAVTPASATADFSGGKILHVTMEVDAHTDSRRWVGMNIAPDALTNFDALTGPISSSNNGLFCQIEGNQVFVDQYSRAFNADGSSHADWDVQIAGNNSALQPLPTGGAYADIGGWGQTGWRSMDGHSSWPGRGLDDRSRFDWFVSQGHLRLYEDGVQIVDRDIPGGLPWATAHVYYTHYVYHTQNEIDGLNSGQSSENQWRYLTPYGDERHWDNMGFEVLPASTSWSSLASRVGPALALKQDGSPIDPTAYVAPIYGGTVTPAKPPVAPAAANTLTGTLQAVISSPTTLAFTILPTGATTVVGLTLPWSSPITYAGQTCTILKSAAIAGGVVELFDVNKSGAQAAVPLVIGKPVTVTYSGTAAKVVTGIGSR